MNSLAELQQRFQDSLLQPDAAIAAAQQGDTSGRMNIYANAYLGRLQDALAENYPVLSRALGDEGFQALACDYARAHPSRHRSIRWFGDGLVDFIARNPEKTPHPALLDIAKMDWAMRGAFDAADANPLRFEDLQRIAAQDWPALRFTLMPSFRILALEWGIESLWHALNLDQDAATEAPEIHPHTMIIWRCEFECRWRTLEAKETTALAAVMAAASFADICAALHEGGDPEPAATAASLLQRWVADGILVGGD